MRQVLRVAFASSICTPKLPERILFMNRPTIRSMALAALTVFSATLAFATATITATLDPSFNQHTNPGATIKVNVSVSANDDSTSKIVANSFKISYNSDNLTYVATRTQNDIPAEPGDLGNVFVSGQLGTAPNVYRIIATDGTGTAVTNVTNAVLTSNVATLTLDDTTKVGVGSTVTVDISNNTYDGSYTVTAVTPTTISYAKTNSNIGSAPVTGTVTSGAFLTPDIYTVIFTVNSFAGPHSIVVADDPGTVWPLLDHNFRNNIPHIFDNTAVTNIGPIPGPSVTDWTLLN